MQNPFKCDILYFKYFLMNKTVAKKGYAILVDGEKYIVGAGKDVIARNGGTKNAIVNAIKKVTAQPVAKTGLNIIA